MTSTERHLPFRSGGCPILRLRRRVGDGLPRAGRDSALCRPSPTLCFAKDGAPSLGCRRRGYLLLEVVVALGLLVLGLATLGMQIQNAHETTYETKRTLRAMNLAESQLAQLEAGLIQNVDSAIEDDLEDEFGRLFPSYGWRLRLEPTETPELWAVRLDILYQLRLDVEEEFDFDEAEIVFTVRTLRATPVTIDPSRDFGADEETMQKLTEALSGTDLDAYALDLRAVGGLPIDQLLELLTAFREAGLLEGINLGSLLPAELLNMLEEAGADLDGDAGTNGQNEGAGGS